MNIEPAEMLPFDIAAWRARLAALDAHDFLPTVIQDDAPVKEEDFEVNP